MARTRKYARKSRKRKTATKHRAKHRTYRRRQIRGGNQAIAADATAKAKAGIIKAKTLLGHAGYLFKQGITESTNAAQHAADAVKHKYGKY